ncbi:MAG: dockerin [Deltaproteobacteria bacterium]|nr:dockerin [Deltaproteobacteria bacterium]
MRKQTVLVLLFCTQNHCASPAMPDVVLRDGQASTTDASDVTLSPGDVAGSDTSDASDASDASDLDTLQARDAMADPDARDASDLSDTGPRDVADAGPTLRIPNAAAWLIEIIGTGQSLSVGAAAVPALTTRNPYANVRLRDTGGAPLYDGVGDRLSLVSLVEPVRSDVPGGQTLYPNNVHGETPHAAMSIELSRFAERRAALSFNSAHVVVGESGRPIDAIRRDGTGRAYTASLYETRGIMTLAAAEGRRVAVGAVLLTHGESDALNAGYEAQVLALARAYNEDLLRITGQTERIPMLLTQQGSFPVGAGRGLSTQAQWLVARNHPELIVCVGPKYHYPYANDHVHLTNDGSRMLGIKYAQVYAQVMFEGRAFRPLEPTSATRTAEGNVRVNFHVPVAPLAFEISIPMPHTAVHPTSGRPPVAWAEGRGFELEQGGRIVTIRSVVIDGESVVITPAVPLLAGDFTVRYAMTQDAPGATAGTPYARAGQLRDSDPYVGFDEVTVTAVMTLGSRNARITAGDLNGHGVRSLVTGPGAPREGLVVTNVLSPTVIELAAPWSGPAGSTTLRVRSDQRNYAVHFELVGR